MYIIYISIKIYNIYKIDKYQDWVFYRMTGQDGLPVIGIRS